ncbi:MAG: hypothetical protein Sapg2KO_14100 [Saprospiraceae bacterium]
MKYRIPISIVLLSVFMAACQSEDGYRDIRNYYFPLKALESGLVYEYEPLGNTPTSNIYWYYRSIIQNGAVNLTGTYYENDLIPLQLNNEQMTEAGMVLKDLYLYEADSFNVDQQRQIPVEIIQDDVFPFNVKKDGGIFLYNIKWSTPNDPGATMELIKNRRYLRDTSFVFQDKKYDAILFELKELVAYDKEGVLEQEYSGQEIYAKGLGLVYYSKQVTEALHLQYRLKERYPMERLEEKFRIKYEPDKQEIQQ